MLIVSIPDLINGCFETVGGLFLLKSNLRLIRDKEVKGVYIPATVFFTAWGFWNTFYYPSLDQWFSFVGGLLIVVMNTWWVTMAIYYGRKKKL